MNEIEKLIQKLCPNGIEFKELGEIGILIRGNGLQKKDFTKEGVGCIHYGQMYTHYGSSANKTKTFVSTELANKLKKAKGGDVLISGVSENIEDICKPLAWFGDEICISGDMFAFRHNQNPKFITYLLQSFNFYRYKRKHSEGVKVTRLKSDKILKFKIPVPPLEVQNKIVEILDRFTGGLEAELKAELKARKRQYGYYQDELLTFDEGFKWVTLNDICIEIFAGGDRPKKYKKGQIEPSEEFPYPIFSNGIDENALYGYSNDYKIDKESVTISARGTIGFHTIRKPKFTPIVRLIILIPDNKQITTKFLNYILDITEIAHSGGSIPQLTIPNVKKIKIQLPSISEQERIVKILNKFDALVNNISSGIPAEIIARRKQYEHYREKLLTFKELK